MKERIQKVLGNAGVASRRNVEEMVRQGRIELNGETVTQLPVLIDPEKDEVRVDGERIRLRHRRQKERVYLLMNKPPGVYTTNVAQGEQVRAIDLLPPGFRGRVYPVGRLDADARGLLLLTDDGELTNLLTHPRYEVPKTDRVQTDGPVPDEDIKQMEEGVWLADPKTHKGFKTLPCRIRLVTRGRDKTVMEFTLREGRNRQVRRMLAAHGHKVRDLMRIRFGPLKLEGLAPGAVRPLTEREVRELKGFVEKRERSGRNDRR